jgi:membrane protease YdiL (CAAX protease family)
MHTTFHKNEIRLFLLLTLGLSIPFYILIIRAGSLDAYGGMYTFLLMWCPGAAALLTRWIKHRNLEGLGWQWGHTKYQLWAYGLPVLYAGLVYLIVWLTGLGQFDWAMLQNFKQVGEGEVPGIVAAAVFIGLGTVMGALSALGAEIGWRGFLVPALYARYNFFQTAFLSGLIWTLWNSPLILFADYHSSAPLYYGLFCFAIMAIGISFALAWLRLKSGSLWTAVLFTTSHALYIQDFFNRLTSDTGITEYFTTEFGAGLALTGILLVIFFYQQRHQLYRDPEAMASERELSH